MSENKFIYRKSILSESKVEYPVKEPFCQITPHQGCIHQCPYCYARILNLRWGRVKRGEWGSVKPIINAPDLLKRELEKKKKKPGTVLISFMTDPYQLIERRYFVTRKCLEVLSRYPKIHVMILTKSYLVLRDLDLLKQMNVEVGFTLISLQPQSKYQPYPTDLIIALRKLRDAKIHTFVSIEPIISTNETLQVFELTKNLVNKYYLGCMNYFKRPKLDYEHLVSIFRKQAAIWGNEVIIKKELKKILECL